MEKKDYSDVDKRLTPEWWKDKAITVDGYFVIPDTEYDFEVEGFDYDQDDDHYIDFNSGVIVKASDSLPGPAKKVGYWCHYRQAGPYEFHPFRKRFTNGESDKFAKKTVKLVKKSDIVMITDKKIF